MPALIDFPARGNVIAINDGVVTFNPLNTNYELRLVVKDGIFNAGQCVNGVIRLTARKVWTVASGGNFISPVLGPPRTLQGRIKMIDGNTMVLHAGVPIVVKLSNNKETQDLVNGPLAVGALANVAAQPGASFQLLA